jgi:hypothetical protein
MPTFPLIDWQLAENAGANTGASTGTTVTANGSGNTKGSYAQLIASTAFSSQMLMLIFDTPNSGTRDFLVDIAIGGAGSEQIIISNLLVSPAVDNTFMGAIFQFAVNIPAGTRIAARCQSSTGSSNLKVTIQLFGAGLATGEIGSTVDTYGENTSDSGGTAIDPGGSANTKGSYTQITASTNKSHRYLTIAFGNRLNGTMTSGSWLVDIAIGGAGSEVVIISNLNLHAVSTADGITPQVITRIPVNIPAGTRIAVRAQSSITDATDRLVDVAIYGES